MHTAAEAAAYGRGLRAIMRALGVSSGDMEKGVMRFEANISVRPENSAELGTKVEIKNLNSFKAMEKPSISRSAGRLPVWKAANWFCRKLSAGRISPA